MAKTGYMAVIGANTDGLDKALKNINSQLKATDNEIKVTNKAIKAAMDAGTDSTEMYGQKLTELKSAIAATEEKLNGLKNVEQKMKELNESGKLPDEEYRKYQREISNTEAKLRSYQTELENTRAAMRDAKKTTDDTTDGQADYQQALKQTQTEQDKTATSSKDLADKMSAVKTSVAKVAEDFKKIAEVVGAVSVAVGGAAVAIGKYSTDVGSAFDASMSKVEAYSQASGDDLQKLRDAAKEAGATTSKTATEAADALGYMSLAGWDTEQMLTGLMPILRASEAGGEDLARTSDLITDSMSALGISVSDLTHYLDVCTSAQSNSNTTLNGLLEAYIGCGGTLKNLNVSVEESAAILGTLANRGIKASEAGNSLNSILVNLVGANKSAANAMSALGVSAWDSEGNFIGLSDTLKILDDALANCTDQEKALFEAKIGGKTQMDTLQALISGVSDEFDGLRETLENSQGTLEETAKTMQDNLLGDLEITKSAMASVGIEISEYLDEPLRGAAQKITEIMTNLSESVKSGELKPQLEEMSKKIGEFIEKIAEWAAEDGIPLLIDGIGKLVDGLSWFVDNLDTVITLAEGLGAAWVTWQVGKLAIDVVALGAAVKGFATAAAAGISAVLSAIPFVAVTAAAAALITVIVKWGVESAKSAKEFKALNADIQAAADDIIATNQRLVQSNADVQSSISKASQETEGQIRHANLLIKKLDELVDENGNLKDASVDVNKELKTLNDTFGTQLEVVNGQIQGWKDLKTSYEDYVQSLRANAKLEAMRSGYVDALSQTEALKNQREADIKAWNDAATAYRQYMRDYEGTTTFDAEMADKLRIDADQAKANLELTMANIELNDKTIKDYEQLAYDIDTRDSKLKQDSSSADNAEAETDEGTIEKSMKAEIEALDKKKKLHKDGLNEDENYYKKKKEIIDKYKASLSDDSEYWWEESDKVTDYYDKQDTAAQKEADKNQKAEDKQAKADKKAAQKQAEEDAKDKLDALIERYEHGEIIRRKFNEELAELEKQWADNEVDIEEYKAKKVKKVREDAAKSDLEKLTESLEDGEIAREEFNKRYAELENQWAEDNVHIEDEAAKKVKSAREKSAKADLDTLVSLLNEGTITREEFNAIDLKLQQENAEDGISIAEYRAKKIKKINEDELKDWEKATDETVKDITKKYEDLAKEQSQIADKIASGDLTEKVTDKNGKERTVFADLNKRTTKIRQYIADLRKLKGTDIPSELLDEIYSMSFDDRCEAVKELLKMSDASRNLYYTDYKKYKSTQLDAAKEQTAEKTAQLNEEAKNAVDDILASQPESSYANGVNTAKAYLQGIIDTLGGAGVPVDIIGSLRGRTTADNSSASDGVSGSGDSISTKSAINIYLGDTVITSTVEKELKKAGILGRNNSKL